MARIYYRDDGQPMRGTVPVGKEWSHGSRQVIRNAMTDMYFNIMSRYNMPRRMRRALARAKMHNVYRATKQEQINMGIVGTLPKKVSLVESIGEQGR